MTPSGACRPLLYACVILLFGLHNDFWIWNNAGSWLGLPAGLTYHIVYCIVVTALMYALVRFAWPDLNDDATQ